MVGAVTRGRHQKRLSPSGLADYISARLNLKLCDLMSTESGAREHHNAASAPSRRAILGATHELVPFLAFLRSGVMVDVDTLVPALGLRERDDYGVVLAVAMLCALNLHGRFAFGGASRPR